MRDRSKYKINNIMKRLTNDNMVILRKNNYSEKEFNKLLNDIYIRLDSMGLIHTTMMFTSCECMIALVRGET